MSPVRKLIFGLKNPKRYSASPPLTRFARLSEAYYSWLYPSDVYFELQAQSQT